MKESEIRNLKSEIRWTKVRRILVVKLRSIGDTVLSTPSLIALRRAAPDARIDVLLEDWVAPVLDGADFVDNVITVGRSAAERLRVALALRRTAYDVAFNLHGGTTATFFVAASGAKHRIGYSYYRYGFLYTRLLSSSSDFWKREKTHSAEQQLALLGFVGIPVEDAPKTRLAVTREAAESADRRVSGIGTFALMHPAAAFDTKQWASENFARVAEHLAGKGITTVAVVTKKELPVLEALKAASGAPIIGFDDCTLPEITALASKARIFIGNDSGIAHIAAAAGGPVAVVFGSSNVEHWRPWTEAPNEVIRETMPCQPCPGYFCAEFGEPRCILTVPSESVIAAVDRLLAPTP
jgi:ADP-heptose:LPS heptosyltransferase